LGLANKTVRAKIGGVRRGVGAAEFAFLGFALRGGLLASSGPAGFPNRVAEQLLVFAVESVSALRGLAVVGICATLLAFPSNPVGVRVVRQ